MPQEPTIPTSETTGRTEYPGGSVGGVPLFNKTNRTYVERENARPLEGPDYRPGPASNEGEAREPWFNEPVTDDTEAR